MMRIGLVLAGILSLSACSQFHVPPYSVNHETVNELRKVRDDGGTLAVGEVSGMNQQANTLTCRAVGPIKPTGTPTFGEYVKEALVAEMSIAEVYVPESDVKVDMDFSQFDFSSTGGEWQFAANVSVKGTTFPVKVTHSFSPSWYGETACDQTAQALMPAVQALVFKVVSDPRFREVFVRESGTGSNAAR